MEFFAYAFAAVFVLLWIVLLVKFLKVVSAGRKERQQETQNNDNSD